MRDCPAQCGTVGQSEKRSHTVRCEIFAVENFANFANRYRFAKLKFAKFLFTRGQGSRRRRCTTCSAKYLPNPSGPLSAEVPSSSIKSANKIVGPLLQNADPATCKKRGQYNVLSSPLKKRHPLPRLGLRLNQESHVL